MKTVEKKRKMERRDVLLKDVELDGSTQCRVSTDAGTVAEYGKVLEGAEGGWPFPEVVVFEDDAGRLWLADGFHRAMAAVAEGYERVPAKVRAGGREEALRVALGANTKHGLRRRPEDVRRCVELACQEWPDLTDRAVAKMVQCSPTSVGKYRPAVTRGGEKTAEDGRVFSEEGRRAINAVADMGRDDDSDIGDVVVERRVDSGSVKTGSADSVREYDCSYVRLDERPSIAEVECWVGEVPTYEELQVGSSIPVVRMRDERGEVANMVRRDLVRQWCAEPATVAGSEPRWDGFRKKPVSLEHAERERERWAKEQSRGEKVLWGVEFLSLLDELDEDAMEELMVAFYTELLKHVPRETQAFVNQVLAKEQAYARYESLEEILVESAPMDRLSVSMLLLVGTRLLERGVADLESTVLRDFLSVLGPEGIPDASYEFPACPDPENAACECPACVAAGAVEGGEA